MSPVEVIGRDVARGAYRVRVDTGGRAVTAFVPECLMESLRPGQRPSHQEAYEWIAAHRGKLEKAVIALAGARKPRPPCDLVTLAEES
ncbi:hypothetical protein [Salipiger sp.]|uniref:hypothetical protein n=1 Tax=Salipiger sp. TaxID=2078585 RepID=UPI003A96A3EB